MNCDQVFDILTRGPFPSGAASDQPVQRHLGACPECRQLAEALRPALDLIHESVPPEESWGLPGYWDDVPPGAHSGAQSHTQPVTVKQRPQLAVRRMRFTTEARRRRTPFGDRWRFVAVAALAGALAAMAVLGVERAVAPDGGLVPNSSTAAAALMPIAWPPKIDGTEHDALAAASTVTHAATNVAAADHLARDLQSCGRCHAPGSEHWALRPATNAIAATCFECHEFESPN